MKEHEEGCKVQQETEERIAAAVLTQGYIAELLPQVLQGLNESGFIYDNVKHGNIYYIFMYMNLISLPTNLTTCK